MNRAPFVVVHRLPHRYQRYDTVGDWSDDGVIYVSEMGVEDYEFLVALHEIVEWYACRRVGLRAAAVDAFDMAWTPHGGFEEPGEDPDAPYHRAHSIASAVERVTAELLKISWMDYEAVLDQLPPHPGAAPAVLNPEARVLKRGLEGALAAFRMEGPMQRQIDECRRALFAALDALARRRAQTP